MTPEDLGDYKAEIRAPLQTTMSNGGWTITSLPPPSCAIVIQYILRILDGKGYFIYIFGYYICAIGLLFNMSNSTT